MKLLLFTVFIAIASLSIIPQYPCSSSSQSQFQWQILTKHNFSSQIRLHPHILLLVALPWSGEARSLMNHVSLAVSTKPKEFASLQLMLMHRNIEKVLADSLGATDEITLVYFHYSVSYKYRGRLRAQNILFSLYPYISLAPEEVPLTTLNTPLDLRFFLDSTDKAIVLVDFCGWTPKLLVKSTKDNGTQNGFTGLGNHHGMGLSRGNSRMPMSRGKTNKKVAVEDTCKAELGVDKGFCEAPWLGEFTLLNYGPLEGSKDRNHHVLHSCSSEEFEQFHSFYLKFMTTVREFFLPPERNRFGLVSNRSMLSYLGVGDYGPWFAVQYQAGCLSCSNILKEEDDLNYVLQMNNYCVKELEGNGHDQEPTLPANKPSVLLFVDRSSESSETRGKSQEALEAFRELAQHYHSVNQAGKKNNDSHDKFSVRDYHGFKSTYEHPRLKLSMPAQKIKLKEKISSVMIINEGKRVSLDNVPSDLQGSSLNEILAYLLQRKNDRKLSSLAKDLGFQLLSDDIDIGLANTQQSHSEVQSNQIPTETSPQGHTDTVMLGGDSYRFSGELEENRPSIVTHEEIKSVQSKESVADYELSTAKFIRPETDDSSGGNKYEEAQSQLLGFNGSFFYSDGNYQLLKRLTGGCGVPSLVIVDPIQQQHYVYPDEKSFNFSSLYDFVSEFLNETLHPYQRSEHVLRSQKGAIHPPFVNLDFHEIDSIPQITAHSFSELVIGFNLSNKENTSNAWNKDVLVLFSNSWCSFCQRMEMVVREVYRAIKGYVDTLNRGSQNVEENLDHVTMKLPVIYLLDCTLNDCDLILKSVDQREVYPALILFPAEKKKPLLYEGDMAVIDVMKFVAEHGSHFHNLIRDKVAVLWLSETAGKNQNLYDALQTDLNPESLQSRNKYHGAPSHDRMLDQVVRPSPMSSPISNDLHEALPHVVIGSMLIATEKLLGVHPFDGSKILIVAANQITGFQGLILNKHIEWNFLPKLEEEFEKLKEAPLSLGGPVMKTGMPLLSLTRTVSANHLPEILPGIYFLDQVTTIRKIEELKSANQPVGDYWFFLGYSSWGWKQLHDEMAEGAWNLSEDATRHLNWP